MPDKSPDLPSSTMVNDDADYKPLPITEDIMLDNDYEPGNLFLNFIYTNNNGKIKTNITDTLQLNNMFNVCSCSK